MFIGDIGDMGEMGKEKMEGGPMPGIAGMAPGFCIICSWDEFCIAWRNCICCIC